MKPRQTSLTAQNNAILRARETLRPADARILDDPYASVFLPERLQTAANADRQMEALIAGWDRCYPGVGNAILVRGRYMDEHLTRALRDGIRQVVILGAGYDTRALRFPALQQNTTVFEVDHPATQTTKRRRMRSFDLPHLRYVPLDFTTDRLDAALLAQGFDPGDRALFVWEGVTYYLLSETIDHTLAAVRRCCAPGSRIVFDVFPDSVVQGISLLPGAWALQNGLAWIGEALRFGIAPERIGRFMNERGFGHTAWIEADRWARSVLGRAVTNRPVSKMFIFVQATVA